MHFLVQQSADKELHQWRLEFEDRLQQFPWELGSLFFVLLSPNMSATCVGAWAIIQTWYIWKWVYSLEAWPAGVADRQQVQRAVQARCSGFIYLVRERRSAAQIDGSMSHLTRCLPPHWTQSHAPVSSRFIVKTTDEGITHLQTAEFSHPLHMDIIHIMYVALHESVVKFIILHLH